MTTYNLTVKQSQEQLQSLVFASEQQPYLLNSSYLASLPQKKYIIFHGYSKLKSTEQSKQLQQSQQPKQKKKFVFKVDKNKQSKALTEQKQKIHLYNVDENKWTLSEAKGKLPPPRQNQRSILLNQNLIAIYGGKNFENDKLLNDLHVLNFQTFVWKKLFSIEGPPSSQNVIIIKLTQTKFSLISLAFVWTFQSKDVKWQLNANELPGGVWQNLSLSFQGLLDPQQEIILSGTNISLDPSKFLLSVFTVNKNTHKVSSFLINLNEKQISRIRLQHEISLDTFNYRNSFFCFTEKLSKNQHQQIQYQKILVYSNNKDKIQVYLMSYNQESHCLNILNSQIIKENNLKLESTYEGICYDPQQSICYMIGSEQNDRRRKLLKSLQLNVQKKIQKSHQIQNSKSSSSLPQNNYMKTSQIHSIAEESNESSVVGIKTFQNEEIDEELDIQNSELYQRRISQRSKQNRSRIISQVNRSPSVQSNEIDSDIQIQKQKPQQARLPVFQQQKSRHFNGHEQQSFNNDSNIYSTQSHNSPISLHRNKYKKNITENASFFPEQLQLHQTLQKILVYEHKKRKSLEQKALILQNSIKNSEKLSKLLTRYANTQQKNRHIEQVKYLKQQLQTIWNKETFFKNQILKNFVSSQSESLSKHQLQRQNKDITHGKIDIKKLLKKHNNLEES